MINKYLCVLVVLIAIGQNSFAQNTYTTPYAHIPSIGVPSPTAASLGTYSSYPVGNFTGVPDINIPLYEINEAGYKLPISISYNASGIRVNDIASWVGLGFSLNAGGVITRNVQGAPDDENDLQVIDQLSNTTGNQGFLYYNYNASVSDINNTPHTVSNPNNLGVQGWFMSGFNTGANNLGTQFQGLLQNRVDVEPDIFSFNFNGHVGKFVFSQGTDPVTNIGTVAPNQHKAMLIPYQDLQISYAFNTADVDNISQSHSWINSFTIVDEAGNTYLFANPEYTGADISGFTFDSGTSYQSYMNYNSSWYLTKITTVLGKVINFNYVTENYNIMLPTTFEGRGFTLPEAASNPTYTTNKIIGVRLSSIEGDDFKVYFDANLARQDIKTNALTAVRIYSKDNSGNQSFIKEFDFGYFNLQSPNVPTSNDVTNGDAYQRLMLSSIQEKDVNGIVKPPYKFTYNNNTPLPNRYSPQQDLWGYFNNNGVTNIQNILPTLYVYPTHTGKDRFSLYALNTTDPSFTISGADRTTNPAAIVSATIQSITYPTGGSTTFQFEPNQFFYNNQNITGGGLRLLSSTEYDGFSTSNNITKQYSYIQNANPTVSSGVLFNMPLYAYTENFAKYWHDNLTTGPGLTSEYDPTTLDYYTHNLVIGSVPQYTMSGFDAVNVGYSEITESTNGNGKTISKYSTPGRFGETTDQVGTCTISAEGYCDGLFTVPVPSVTSLQIVCPNGTIMTDNINPAVDLAGIDTSSPFCYPFAPSLNYDWNRGLLMSKTVYNQNGNPVTDETNLYSVYTPKNASPLYVYGLRMRFPQSPTISVLSCSNSTFSVFGYNQYARYPIITNVAKQLSSKTTKTYSSTNPANYTASTTSYTYSPNCIKPSMVETTTSRGDLIDEFMTYPPDYTQIFANAGNNQALALYNMQQQHVINPVVEEYTKRKNADGTNPRTTSAYLTTFKLNQPLADSVFRSESAGPVSGFLPATINNGGITKDQSYKPYLSFDFYDGNGNILQQHKIGDPNNAYIWDYDKQFPVAIVKNALPNDIAYTSFEADGSGGWNLTPSAIVSDPTSPTGSKCYNLSSAHINDNLLTASKSYIISYWIKNQTIALGLTNGSTYLTNNAVVQGPTINGWTYFQHTISGTTNVQFVGSCFIDELRLYPTNAQMTTYTYNPLIGETSSTDAKGEISYYEYDSFQRLMNVRDKDGNIIKHIDYHYQGQ